jgi:hypothetical protein
MMAAALLWLRGNPKLRPSLRAARGAGRPEAGQATAPGTVSAAAFCGKWPSKMVRYMYASFVRGVFSG